jgi:hypothetical protein
MTPADLRALIDQRVATDAEFAALVATGEDKAIADALSVGRVRHVSRLVTERGVISALGPIEGEAALQALEAFAATTLPDGHPLKSSHAGIARTLSWLKPPADGIDIGDALTRQLLSTFGALGVLSSATVTALLALSAVPDPIGYAEVSTALAVAEG